MALLSMSQMMSRPSWATDSRMLASEGWGSSTYTSSYHTTRTSYRKTHMQTLDKLCTWARNWGMEFNVTKCHVMHVGKHNKRHTYSMDWIALARTEERDIAVVLSDHLKPLAQCKKAAKTANAVLGQILGAFHFRDRHTFLDLYQQQVRPHLEFAVAAWSPWTVADIECLERVQQKAVSGLKGRTYEERLAEVSLLSLRERRKETEMVKTFKIVRGIDMIKDFLEDRAVLGHKQGKMVDRIT